MVRIKKTSIDTRIVAALAVINSAIPCKIKSKCFSRQTIATFKQTLLDPKLSTFRCLREPLKRFGGQCPQHFFVISLGSLNPCDIPLAPLDFERLSMLSKRIDQLELEVVIVVT